MEFTWLNKQGVRSALGFEVQNVDRYTAQYQEGERVLTVHVRPGVDPERRSSVLLVSPEFCQRWDDMPPSAMLDGNEQARIAQNFCRAFEFMDVPIVVL